MLLFFKADGMSSNLHCFPITHFVIHIDIELGNPPVLIAERSVRCTAGRTSRYVPYLLTSLCFPDVETVYAHK